MTPFNNSYIVTARKQPSKTHYRNIEPLADGKLWFYSAPTQYNPEATEYEASGIPAVKPPASYLSMLQDDLKIAIQNGCPQLTVVVHGLGVLFSDAIGMVANAGTGLQTNGYGGLAIGFDWPSYNGKDSAANYSSQPYAFPPTADKGNIRANINGTVTAFQNFLATVQALTGVTINYISHSEGNYMMMDGLNSATGVSLQQILLVAADINSGALQTTGLSQFGQGLPISKAAKQVTVYYSSGDDVLPASQTTYKAVHNPSYPDRLGLEGPASYAAGALATNAIGLNCSAVVQKHNPAIPPGIKTHDSYFYIPQVLSDMAQTLNGVSAGSVTNRVSAGQPDGQGYTMNLVGGTS
jgi:esterase/lipase superfamily enzyme